MPHAVGTKEMAQHSGQRHDEYDVAAQRDDQRFCALAKASSAPEEVVDTAETTKPRQMMRRAVWPMATVSGLEVNSCISGREANRQMTVPAAMMAALMMRVSS